MVAIGMISDNKQPSLHPAAHASAKSLDVTERCKPNGLLKIKYNNLCK